MKNALKRTSLLLFLCLILTAISAQAQNIRYTLLENNADGALVRVEFPNYTTSSVDVNGVTMQKLAMPKAYPVLEAGAPELLHTSFSLMIPEGSQPTAEVIESEYTMVPNFELAPSKGKLYRNVNPADVAYMKGSSYFEDRFQKDNVVNVGEPYLLRDYNGVALHVYPFAYNPVKKQLKAYSSITVRVRYNSNRSVKSAAKVARAFNNIYADHFLNYNPMRYTSLQENGDMLILAPDAYCASMQPYADWKIRNGYSVEIVPLSVAGSTSSAIKNYILDYYNSHNLVYVVTVGDNQQFPTISAGGNVSDNYYGELVGNDHYPDVIIGKISAENLTQVNTQVNKFIQYEQGPNETAHLPVFLGIASNQGPGDNNEYDYDHIRNIDNILTNYTYTSGYELFEGSQGGLDQSGSPTASMVTEAVNSGVGIINYCGHGSETNWVTTGFSVSNINMLTNYDKLPFIISVACVNGDYSGKTCFAEAWLRAKKSNRGTGAVGALMSTINQPWDSPMCAQDHMNELLTGANNVTQKRTFGGIIFNGLLKMLDEYNDYEVARTWILFGDPSLMVRTAVPDTLVVSHMEQVNFGVSDVNFISSTDARVTLTCHNQILTSGQISNGSLTLSLPSTLGVMDTVEVLATAPNYIPYQGSIQIVPNQGPFLICQDFVVNDAGNQNGQADYGETVNLGVVMKNVGTQAVNNAQVRISTSDPYLTIITDNMTVAYLDSNAVQTYDNVYQVRVSEEVPASHVAIIEMEILLDDDTVSLAKNLMLHAPLFELGSVVVDDATTGNGDGKLDLGEIAYLTVPIHNVGNGVSCMGGVMVVNPDATLSIYRFTQLVPALLPDESYNLKFKVKASATNPSTALVRINFVATDGFTQTREFLVKVGSVEEDFETGDFSSFNWVLGSSNPWTITTQNPYEGYYAARSANIGNAQNSTLYIQRTHDEADSLSFYFKVSSEEDYDFLYFYIDNEEVGKWSGEVGWTRFSTLVPAGTHTYRWRYKKDYYMNAGQDMAMIDAISFPCITKSVGIEDFAHQELSVSPNPTKGAVTLQIPEEMVVEGLQCQIFDLTGRMLGSQAATGATTTLSLASFPAGVYILKITDNQSVINTVKIIKQ